MYFIIYFESDVLFNLHISLIYIFMVVSIPFRANNNSDLIGEAMMGGRIAPS